MLEAMAEAASWDSIAREYVTDFEITFTLGIPSFKKASAEGIPLRDAVTQTFLVILSVFHDTLIARKRGRRESESVSAGARHVLQAGVAGSDKWRDAVLEFDSRLRDRGNSLNPGTTADITVAVLFCEILEAFEKGKLPDMLRKW